MTKTKVGAGVEALKSLELKLVECLGTASVIEVPMAATLIGAALEEIGVKIEQEYGVSEVIQDTIVRFDN
jgi:hypothetical protein